MQEEKLAKAENNVKNVVENAGPWAHVRNKNTPWAHVRQEPSSSLAPMMDSKDAQEAEKEFHEEEKRKMNIVIRGLTEAENEQVLTLNTDVTDVIADHFGMKDVVVFGAHRVSKKKIGTHRAIVCTLLDARKRAIILDNARFYLKDSPYYITEDRTPKVQQARREAYEERIKKKATPQEEGQQDK